MAPSSRESVGAREEILTTKRNIYSKKELKKLKLSLLPTKSQLNVIVNF